MVRKKTIFIFCASVSLQFRNIMSTAKILGSNQTIPPSYAWLTVFVPALAYFLGSRLQDTRLSGRALGSLVQNQIRILLPLPSDLDPNINTAHASKKIFYIDSTSTSSPSSSENLNLRHGLYLVQSLGLEEVVDTIWKHDEALGRGYLLLSQSTKNGRIWRWEVGGGPIAIGKTLHMDPSGCRSNIWNTCYRKDDSNHDVTPIPTYGSGALALDFSSQATSFEGRLVVTEWGERRIVRLEESGARTPLLMTVPSLCLDDSVTETSTTTSTDTLTTTNISTNRATNSTRRLYRPRSILYTTYGDLIVADQDVECGQAALYYVAKAMTIPALSSTMTSRLAHSWTENPLPSQLFYTRSDWKAIGGLAMDVTWTSLFVTVQLKSNTIQLLRLSLSIDDEDEDNQENELLGRRLDVIQEWSVSKEEVSSQKLTAGPLVVDQTGNLYVGIKNQVVVLTAQGTQIATLDLTQHATSITLGQDGYLYITSSNALFRIKIRSQPLKIPTNMAVTKMK
jgi:hypothetical protein